MNCRTAKKHILARRDAVLPEELEADLQEHVRHCAPCARSAQESNLMFQWLQETPDAEPSENFDWRLRLRLAEIDRRGTKLPLWDEAPARHRWTLRFAVSAAAAAVLVLSVGLMRFDPNSSPATSSRAQTSPRQPVLVDPNPGDSWRTVSPASRPDAAQVRWPRPVPVSHGVRLGPEYPLTPAPSILGSGHAEADTVLPNAVRPNTARYEVPQR